MFEGLDYQAIIYLNGEEIGRHANAHRPCRLEVTGRLRAGRNLLAVVVESGLQYVADRAGADYSSDSSYTLAKRHWLRKAQYEAGWDWHPRLLNVGITGAVSLEIADEPGIDTIVVLPTLADDHSRASLEVRAFLRHTGRRPVTMWCGRVSSRPARKPSSRRRSCPARHRVQTTAGRGESGAVVAARTRRADRSTRSR